MKYETLAHKSLCQINMKTIYIHSKEIWDFTSIMVT
jgi:hypothetical protein